MEAATRKLVRDRAGDRCEYCQLPQSDLPLARFHIEHVIAKQHGGTDVTDNLALACQHCNLNKGPNLARVYPQTGRMERLFDPRRDTWIAHFERRGLLILGITPSG